MGYYDRLNRKLIKNIKNVWPFTKIEFPKTIKCVNADLTAAGVEWFEENIDSVRCFWRSSTFEGDYILVTFDCEDDIDKGLNIQFHLKTIDSDTYTVTTGGLEAIFNELKFVKDVLEFSEY